MKSRLVVLMAGVVLLQAGWGAVGAPAADAGPRVAMAEKVFKAEAIVEVRLPLDLPIPKQWPNKGYDPKGLAFPNPLFDRAMKGMKIERLLKAPPSGKPPALPKQIYVFSIGSPCWWKAHQHGSLRSLVFLRSDKKGRFEDSGGVEHEDGRYSDLNPDYEGMVRAIQEAVAWQIGKDTAAPPEQRAAQRKILTSTHDPYRLYLAVHFLTRHDAALLDEVWGAPGTPGRSQYDRMVVEPAMPSACQPAAAP